MDSPIPEVHPPGDMVLYLYGPAYVQLFFENDVGKYKGSLGVPDPVQKPL